MGISRMKTISKLFFSLFGAMLLGGVIAVLLVGGLEWVNLSVNHQTERLIGSSITILCVAYIFEQVTSNMKRKSIDTVALRTPVSIVRWIQYFIVVMGMVYVLHYLSIQIIHLIELVFAKTIENEDLMKDVPLFIYFICGVIISPAAEEIIFRKILLERLLPYGKTVAIIVSSLFFGMMHGNIEQFLYTFFSGIIFANLVIISGKLSYSIYMHMLVNFFGGIVGESIQGQPLLIVVVVTFFVFGGTLILILYGKEMFPRYDEEKYY